MAETQLELAATLTPEQAAAVETLVNDIADNEQVRPLSDHVMLQLRFNDEASGQHLLLRKGDELLGYAWLADSTNQNATAEIAGSDAAAVTALLDALVAGGDEDLRIWAHGESSNAAAVMTRLGLSPDRVLLQLRRPLSDPLPELVLPAGITLRTFVVGQDEPAWLAVNNVAFADHPEQSNWTLADIDHREHQPWFDPAGFFLAEQNGVLVGFHWTKVHGEHQPEPIGEVYVVGVSPAMQGQHLGSALTLVGLIHLRELGLRDVMLYVDESNSAAVRVYERLGFTRWDADISFAAH